MLAVVVALTLSAAKPADLPPSRAESKEWVVQAHPKARYTVGKAGTVEVLVGTRAGFHLNDDCPISFVPSDTEGLGFAKVKFDSADGLVQRPCPGDSVHQCAARLPVTFTPGSIGKARVSGTLSFGTCNADVCRIEQVEVSAAIQVGKH